MQSLNQSGVELEVLTAAVISVAVALDVATCIPYMKQRFGIIYHLIIGVKSKPSKTLAC
jgi:hypothetical protein